MLKASIVAEFARQHLNIHVFWDHTLLEFTTLLKKLSLVNFAKTMRKLIYRNVQKLNTKKKLVFLAKRQMQK